MDNISGLPDELLVKILSFVPTKVAVSTSVLSKRWQFLWLWLPKLEYGSSCASAEYKRLLCFLHRNLPLHRAPVIESLRLKFVHSPFKPKDIKLWVLATVSRLRELEISYTSYLYGPDILPSSLYICKSLVTLKLNGTILVDVPHMVCLPSLKTLRLESVRLFNEDSLQRLLSNCPVLEDLLVEGYKMRKFSVIVPSLQRLTLYIFCYDLDEFVMNTPSLKHLKFRYYNSKSHYCLIENMPKLRKAYVSVSFPYIESLLGSITSVKRFTLRLSSEALYGDGFVFNQLEHLKLLICEEYSMNLLNRLLQDSPNLRALELQNLCSNGMAGWNQPSTVPECVLSSLQTFKCSGYIGRPDERDVAIYILQNARHLKIATILSNPYFDRSTIDMLKELALSSLASTKCQLLFN